MAGQSTDIEVYNRKFSVRLEGLEELEVAAVARMVDDRMRTIAAETNKAHSNYTADSAKLAILTALEIAAELHRLQSETGDLSRDEKRSIDGMVLELERSLEGI